MKKSLLEITPGKSGSVFCFLLVLFLGTSPLAKAQALSGLNPTKKIPLLPKLYVGIKIGSNFSYLSGNNWSNGVKSNMLGGVFAGIKGLGFGAQAEGLFEQSEYTTGNGFYGLYKDYYNRNSDSLKQGTFRVTKLSLPLLLQFKVAKLFWLQTGVQFYGIVSVHDFNGLVKDSKALFRSGNTAGVIGTAFHFRNADIGARAIFDFQNLNNISSADVWRQYMLQAHIGLKLF